MAGYPGRRSQTRSALGYILIAPIGAPGSAWAAKTLGKYVFPGLTRARGATYAAERFTAHAPSLDTGGEGGGGATGHEPVPAQRVNLIILEFDDDRGRRLNEHAGATIGNSEACPGSGPGGAVIGNFGAAQTGAKQGRVAGRTCGGSAGKNDVFGMFDRKAGGGSGDAHIRRARAHGVECFINDGYVKIG